MFNVPLPKLSLSLDDDRATFRPGDVGKLTIQGAPNTTVGLVAVDAAVYQLRNTSFTRESVS